MNTTDEKTITNNGIINEAEAQEIATPQVEGNKSEKTWKKVALGNGLAGIALGAAGFFLGEENAQAQPVEEEKKESEEHHAVIKGDAPVAAGDYDEMSFSDAFAAAREEVGPGGVFEWHGQLYGTYYATEWDAMTDEEKDQYFHSVYGANAHHANNDAPAEEAEANDTPAVETEANDTPDVNEDKPEEVDDKSDGAQINVLDQDVVEGPGGEEIGVISAEVDGHYSELYDYDNDGSIDAALVDTNDDGIADVALVDEDGNGTITPNEVYPVEDDAMSAGTTEVEDALYGDTPDYVNDADTSAF